MVIVSGPAPVPILIRSTPDPVPIFMVLPLFDVKRLPVKVVPATGRFRVTVSELLVVFIWK